MSYPCAPWAASAPEVAERAIVTPPRLSYVFNMPSCVRVDGFANPSAFAVFSRAIFPRSLEIF
ncbi:MAG TPA: hypothetical protein DCZ49_07770 [Hyphomonadaceae bacterium]|nr:hypothetical protein [Hyphomonadaceae bacterium]